MQSRNYSLEQATDPQIAVSHETLRNPVVDNTNVSGQPEAGGPNVEALRSYRDVYKRVRYALDHPAFWGAHRARQFHQSYGLPLVWGIVGCVVGLGYTVIHHKMTPSVNLPSKAEMTAVFALHDLSELLLGVNPPVRVKP